LWIYTPGKWASHSGLPVFSSTSVVVVVVVFK
jgi:hypothetical protein